MQEAWHSLAEAIALLLEIANPSEAKAHLQTEASITEQLNQLYAQESSSLDDVLQQLQALSIPREEW